MSETNARKVDLSGLRIESTGPVAADATEWLHFDRDGSLTVRGPVRISNPHGRLAWDLSRATVDGSASDLRAEGAALIRLDTHDGERVIVVDDSMTYVAPPRPYTLADAKAAYAEIKGTDDRETARSLAIALGDAVVDAIANAHLMFADAAAAAQVAMTARNLYAA